MTPEQVTEYAKHLDPAEVISERTAERDILFAALRALPPRAAAALQRKLIDSAEAFQRSSTPGHRTWYPHHLQVAARAIELFEQLGIK